MKLLKKLENSLAVRLTVWFLLLSSVPVALMTVFMHQSMTETLYRMAIANQKEQVRLLSRQIGMLENPGEVQALVERLGCECQQILVVDLAGKVIAHSSPEQTGSTIFANLPASLANRVLQGGISGILEPGTNRIITYASGANPEWIVLIVSNESPVSTFTQEIEQEAVFQLSVSLFLISIGSGLVIWLFVGKPLRQFTQASQQISEGNLSVTIVSEAMVDELGVLRDTFNQMTSRLRELVTGLEQRLLELHHSQQAQEESEQRLQAIFHAVNDAIFMLDIEKGEILDANQKMNEMFGLSLQQVRNVPFEIINSRILPEASDVFHRILTESSLESKLFELQARHRNGRIFWIEFNTRRAVIGGHERVIVAARDITQRKLVEDELRVALQEKETLLRELYHRTKNNMGVIIGLLELQASEFQDNDALQKAFLETGNRIRSMALVHQKLYETSDLSQINLKEYISSLTLLLMSSYRISPGKITFHSDMSDVMVLIDTAIPCGLIINELISNSLKHAFPDGRSGEIGVTMRRDEEGVVCLEVRDNGVGFPAGFDVRRDSRMGMRTLFALAEAQLRATINFQTRAGVLCRLSFRDNLYDIRV